MKNYKKIIGLCLLLAITAIFISSFDIIAYAGQTDVIQDVRDINVNDDENTKPLNPRDYYTQPEEYQPEVDDKYKGQNPLERMIANIFTSLATGIYEILQIKDPLMLIFDYEPQFDIGENHVSRENLYLGIYDQTEMSVVTIMYKTFQAYLPLWLFVAIVLTGLFMVFSGFGGDPRLTAKQYISGILLACVLLLFGPNLIDLVFDAAYTGVDVIKGLIERTAAERGIELPKSLLAVLLAGFMRSDTKDVPAFISDFSLITGLMYAIIIFIIFIGAGVMNWQYIVRKITLAVLIFMFPIVAGLAVFPNTRGALKMWFSEFFANVFLVLAHAIVYGFLIMISMSPEQSFSPLEIIIFIVGLNGIVGIVRGMFGAHQGRSGALGGMGNLLGLTSLMGLGRMAMGMKGGAGGIGGLLTGKTAQEAVGQATSAVSSKKEIDKIAGIGNDLSPSQVSLMNAQMLGNETDEQKMELSGPQKDLSIESQVQSAVEAYQPERLRNKLAKIGGTATRIGGAAAIGSAGALISGMVTGNATAGIATGAMVGKKLTDGAINTSKNIVKAFRNPNAMGIYNAGQLFDSKSAIQIGQNIGGKPGAVVGWAANKVVHPFKIGSFEAKNQATSLADGVRTDISNQYVSAQQSYQESQQKMQLAQYSVQQIEQKYPEASKENNMVYQQEKQQAVIHLEDSKNQFHESQVSLKEAEMRKQKEHEYVGIQMKMASIRRAATSSSGGII